MYEIARVQRAQSPLLALLQSQTLLNEVSVRAEKIRFQRGRRNAVVVDKQSTAVRHRTLGIRFERGVRLRGKTALFQNAVNRRESFWRQIGRKPFQRGQFLTAIVRNGARQFFQFFKFQRFDRPARACAERRLRVGYYFARAALLPAATDGIGKIKVFSERADIQRRKLAAAHIHLPDFGRDVYVYAFQRGDFPVCQKRGVRACARHVAREARGEHHVTARVCGCRDVAYEHRVRLGRY